MQSVTSLLDLDLGGDKGVFRPTAPFPGEGRGIKYSKYLFIALCCVSVSVSLCVKVYTVYYKLLAYIDFRRLSTALQLI